MLSLLLFLLSRRLLLLGNERLNRLQSSYKMLIDQSDIYGFAELLNTLKVHQRVLHIVLWHLIHHLDATVSFSLLHARLLGHIVVNFQQVSQFCLERQRLKGLSGLLFGGVLNNSHASGLNFTVHNSGLDVESLHITILRADLL